MMAVTLRKWENPKDAADVRVYVNVQHEWHASALVQAFTTWFTATERGEIKRNFKPSYDGRYGYATDAVIEHFVLTDVPFPELLERIDAALTPSGNFSEIRYFKNLRLRRPVAA